MNISVVIALIVSLTSLFAILVSGSLYDIAMTIIYIGLVSYWAVTNIELAFVPNNEASLFHKSLIFIFTTLFFGGVIYCIFFL